MAKIEGYHLQQTGDEVQEILNTPVKTIQQTLTEEQKAQARENIGATSSAVSITYSALVTLRTGGNLVPGQYYRITDYVTTTADAESRSVGHLFDVIVLALDESHLSEEAFATHHDGDTYFANSALDAWRIWYCLDNDTTRFGWADTTNGKGVIYRMVDEWDNDLPYDFKNIQFKRYKVTAKAAYSDALSVVNGLYIGLPGANSKGFDIDSSDSKWYYTFSTLGNDWGTEVTDGSLNGKAWNNAVEPTNIGDATPLCNIVFANGEILTTFRKSIHSSAKALNNLIAKNNHFGAEIINLSIFGPLEHNNVLHQFRHNIMLGLFGWNTFSTRFDNNSLIVPYECSNNSFGSDFFDNIFYIDSNLAMTRFFEECCHNTIYKASGASSHIAINRTKFGSYFKQNTISLLGNMDCCEFGEGCYSNTITNAVKMSYLRCGSLVANNTFTDIEFGSIEINGQLANCTFTGKFTACSFEPICGYVDFVGGTNGAACVGLDVVGSVRGTSSSHVTISSSNFILPDASGTNRRIRLEGATDGSIIATWKGTDGVPTGIRSTDNGATWAAYSPAPIDVVKYTAQSLSDAQKAQARSNIGAGTYSKPSGGIPASDLASGVIPDVSQFITRSVNDLANYYLKSETYTKDEVAALIGAIQQFHYEIYASRQDVVSPANNVLYLIGPTGSGTDKYEEYVYDSTKQEPWVKIGDTSIDLSGYVTTQALNTALAAYTTSADLATLLAGKADKSDTYTKQQVDNALAGKTLVTIRQW